MTVGDIIKYLEDWAPPGVAWERDNVGLQIGSRRKRVKNILLCLELNQNVLDEAIYKNCNFIFTHHPLIFNPIKKLELDKDNQASLFEKIIKNNISVYSSHTNLDFSIEGVSFALANTLGLKKTRFLLNEFSNQFKVVVFVPEKNLNAVSDAIFESGGGKIGNYEKCGFRLNGTGTFLGSSVSNPTIGQKEKFEQVDEVRFEFIVDKWNLTNVINAVIKTHPYEEPAYDVYPLQNMNIKYGSGTIGELDKDLSVESFLKFVSKSLSANNLRFCKGAKTKIRKVAVCGGSGSDLLTTAIEVNADAFVTSDIKYHTFQKAEGKILLIDAGHYETEVVVLDTVHKKIKQHLIDEKDIKIFKYSGSTNPIKYYKH
ncbi:MAG: Nif3-like dinuclear metal center hexameric protein [Ignavibacteria bacterium]|nr:Nif3-like dinuclear metal center hexameric protein [Ignavibacteria bacterium]